MSVVSLALFKKHVRADDFAEDDEYLEYLIDTAEDVVIRATNCNPIELLDAGYGEFPKPLKHAIMMLAAHWYNQRESVSSVQMHQVPDALQALIKPYRKLVSNAGRTDEISN